MNVKNDFPISATQEEVDEFVRDLNNRQRSAELNRLFEAKGVQFSPAAIVIVLEQDRRWRIDDTPWQGDETSLAKPAPRYRFDVERRNPTTFYVRDLLAPCPHCGERIARDAEKCVWCGEFTKSSYWGFKRKTLWDWLSLLVVPAVLIFGGWILNSCQANQQQRIEAQRARAAMLEAFLDDMMALEQQADAEETGEIQQRSIIRARTMSVLTELNPEQRLRVLGFLKDHYPEVLDEGMQSLKIQDEFVSAMALSRDGLCGAHLRGLNLSYTDLSGVDMRGANLAGADLTKATLANAILTEYKRKPLDGIRLRMSAIRQQMLGPTLRTAVDETVTCAYTPRNMGDRRTFLSGINLTDANLTGVNLAGVDLTEANLHGADLTGANLTGATLVGADLTDANLNCANLEAANLNQARLHGALTDDADTECDNEVRQNGLDAKWIAIFDLTNQPPGSRAAATVDFGDFSNANLTGVDFAGIVLTAADLTNAVMTGVDLTDVDLTGAKLVGANLSNAQLGNAVLAEADLTNADLTGADLTGADLCSATLEGANLDQALLRDVTIDDLDDACANGLAAKWDLVRNLLAGSEETSGLEGPGDLNRRDLSNANLSGVDLSGFDLTDANLANAVLVDADLTGAILTNTDLTGANLTDADVGCDSLAAAKGVETALLDEDCSQPDQEPLEAGQQSADAPAAAPPERVERDYSNQDLTEANFAGRDFSGDIFVRADLAGNDLQGTIFSNADLQGAILSSANLKRANLSNANLNGADLTDATLTDAIMSGADLRNANLRNAALQGVDLRGVLQNDATQLDRKWKLVWRLVNGEATTQQLSGIDLRNANLTEIDLHGHNLNGALLADATLTRAVLAEADLSDADLTQANLRSADLQAADLRNADLISTTLAGANLLGADLALADLTASVIDETTQLDDKWRLVWQVINAAGRDLNLVGRNLSQARLTGVDLSGADLTRANLSRADLVGVDLRNADLNGVLLRDAALQRADLRGADLRNADLSGANLLGTDLRRAALDNARFDGARYCAAQEAAGRTQFPADFDPGANEMINDCRE